MSGKISINRIYYTRPAKILLVEASHHSNQKCVHILEIEIPTYDKCSEKFKLDKKRSPNCYLIFRCALIWSNKETWKCSNLDCLLHTSIDRNVYSKLASSIWKKCNEEIRKLFKDLQNQFENQRKAQRTIIDGSSSYNPNNILDMVDQSALLFQPLPYINLEDWQKYIYSVYPEPVVDYYYHDHDNVSQ
ncbi:14223_t:CDS:1 [Ambispora leptoticha]|uniref:14223_t:CDS:1 n=1 Tax=Ambispora leptoticha TaxID=144679 RepID=A0A9N9CLR5_9GLOM|nr:14223_t:CDS:1 [Ambispora leptoticha]